MADDKKDGLSILPWKDIVEGLKAKPAYLLIFAICAVFLVCGGTGTIFSAVKGNNVSLGIFAFMLCFALLIGYLAICKVEGSPEIARQRRNKKILKQLKSSHPKSTTDLDRIRAEVETLLNKDTRVGDFRIGYRYRDPDTSMPMTHRIVGLPGEADRMADIMAAFVKLTQREEQLDFQKLVFPKSGNVLFTIRAAEKIGMPAIGFRGKGLAITNDDSLHPLENYFDGLLDTQDKVAIIDDITFRGDTVKETISYLQASAISVVAVFVLCAHKEHTKNLRKELHEEYRGVKFFSIVEI